MILGPHTALRQITRRLLTSATIDPGALLYRVRGIAIARIVRRVDGAGNRPARNTQRILAITPGTTMPHSSDSSAARYGRIDANNNALKVFWRFLYARRLEQRMSPQRTGLSSKSSVIDLLTP